MAEWNAFIEAYKVLSGVGFGGLLALILWGSKRRVWVWGYQLDEVKAERDEWKRMALQGVGLLEKSITIKQG